MLLSHRSTATSSSNNNNPLLPPHKRGTGDGVSPADRPVSSTALSCAQLVRVRPQRWGTAGPATFRRTREAQLETRRRVTRRRQHKGRGEWVYGAGLLKENGRKNGSKVVFVFHIRPHIGTIGHQLHGWWLDENAHFDIGTKCITIVVNFFEEGRERTEGGTG